MNALPQKARLKSPWILIPLAVLVAFILGYMLRGDTLEKEGTSHSQYPEAEQEAQVRFWTCSMHPQVQSPTSGQCPICFMDLIPVTGSPDEGLDPRQLKLSPAAEKLAGIQTALAERKYVEAEIRMAGKVDFDETRLTHVTAWIPGRLERLYVDYTGIAVRKGDHMVDLYSPDLLTAQEELIQARRALKELPDSGLRTIRQSAQETVGAAREKLRLWGLTEEQVAQIEQRGKPADRTTLYSPAGGIVVHKDAFEGMYVETGTRIYTIADLSRIWVKLDAYESDLAWLRYGQDVEIEAEAYPGEVFKGKVAFIDPVLDERTRTVKVRVNVPNEQSRLKPGLFVRGVVRSKIAAGGKVMDPALAGKWISPMHPEVVKDGPGACDVCGMPLVRAESLGYVSAGDPSEREAPLVIPSSAPLITGKRAVVYVAVPDREGVYEGREVTLGSRAGDAYIVRDGLEEGEQVVVNGNFKIDSAIQILAGPSMMNPEGQVYLTGHQHHSSESHTSHDSQDSQESHSMNSMDHSHSAVKESPKADVPEAFLAELDRLHDSYFAIQQALSQDNLEGAKEASEPLRKILQSLPSEGLSGEVKQVWEKERGSLLGAAEQINKADNMIEAREAFFPFSQSLIAVTKQLGGSGKQPVLLFHCPMAFEWKGAYWLQNKEGVENPYFGSAMFRCGTQEAALVEASGGPQR